MFFRRILAQIARSWVTLPYGLQLWMSVSRQRWGRVSLFPSQGRSELTAVKHSMTATAPRLVRFWHRFRNISDHVEFWCIIDWKWFPDLYHNIFKCSGNQTRYIPVPGVSFSNVFEPKLNGRGDALYCRIGTVDASVASHRSSFNSTSHILFEFEFELFEVFVSPKTFRKGRYWSETIW